MTKDFIEQFMWSFQEHFARQVECEAEALLKAMGCPTAIEVVLVGFAQDEGALHQVCIEPENRNYLPGDFAGIGGRADILYHQHPRSKAKYGDRRSHQRVHATLRDQARSDAIKETLETRHPAGRSIFFVGQSVPVEGYEVHTAVGIPADVVESVPTLCTDTIRVGMIESPVTTSLLMGAIRELLVDASRTLYLPEPGSDLIGTLGQTVEGILRSAGARLLNSTVVLAGELFGGSLFEALTEISTMRYEKRSGLGRMILVAPDHKGMAASLTLQQPVAVSEHRTVRKLLEMSTTKGLSLLTDGNRVYGLGRYTWSGNGSEDAFEITIEGQGTWNLKLNEVPLMHVEYGVPRLPEPRLDRVEFAELATRVLGEGCKVDELWKLAEAAAVAEHGTMLVVSAGAETEAERLGAQAIVVQPTALDKGTVRCVTSIDGAVLVDPQGDAHAIGVILDGTASATGDPSRGARYNSAVRYLKTSQHPTLIVLVSEDGMINLLPRLRPRIRQQDLTDCIDALRGLASIDEGDFNVPEFNRVYNRLKTLSFYLSQKQCHEINALRKRADAVPPSPWNEVRGVYHDLTPHDEMSDDYFVDAKQTIS